MSALTLRNRVAIVHSCLVAIATNAAADTPPAPRNPARVALAREHYAKRKDVIAKFQHAIDRHLNFAKHEVLRKLEERGPRHGLATNADAPAGGVAADIMFDKQRFADGLLAALRNESTDALQTASDQLLEEIGGDPWTMPDPLVRPFLETRQNLLANVPNEIFSTIQDEIATGVEAGDSIAELRNRITDAFEGIGSGRATTIASTETGTAYGFARQEAMNKAGVQFKSWLTSHLPNVRLAHAIAELENQRIPLDQPFKVGGEDLLYPGDENGSPENTINCHCVALAEAA
jgi:uncharacterized protein with gpF-like domain